MTPAGLREAHAHIAMHGRALTMLHLGACVSREECLEVVRREAGRLNAADPGGRRWLLAHGARVEAWGEPRWPTRDELDAIVGGRPASLMSFDHHALLAGTAAFRAAGIDDADADPEGGVIVRGGDGNPTGLLLEASSWLVRRAIPELSEQERAACVAAALDDLACHGFVEVHDLLAPPWLGPLLATMHDRGALRHRIEVYVPLEELDAAVASAPRWERPGLRLAGAKVFADGTLNSRTAWMLRPFASPLPGHPCGTPLMSVATLRAAMDRCAAAGLTLAVHAIGDGAVRAVLDAAAGCAGRPPVRIEHAEIVDAADVPRFAELGVVASVQPCHLLADIEVLRRELPDRLDRVLPLRELIAAGLEPGRTLLFGSDVPIVRADPGDSIQAATARRRAGVVEREALGLSQAIEEEVAWQCFRISATQ